MSVVSGARADGTDAQFPPEPVLQLSVDQYHAMIDAAILVDGDPIELLEGWLIRKMTKDPPHTLSVGCTNDVLTAIVGSDWHVRTEGPVTTTDSEPEPELSVVRGRRRDYTDRHPRPDEVGLLVEVADTSLERDRTWKKRIYANAGIPCYWIVNLVNHQVEVFHQPTASGATREYAIHEVFGTGEEVPVLLDGKVVGRAAVKDLLP